MTSGRQLRAAHRARGHLPLSRKRPVSAACLPAPSGVRTGARWMPARRGDWRVGGMSARTGVACARSIAGRIAGVSAAVALLASAVGFSAPQAAAGLASGDSIPETTVLPANVNILPGDTDDVGTIEIGRAHV